MSDGVRTKSRSKQRARKQPASKQATQKAAVKVKRFGTTWWGRRWLETLEHLSREYLSHLGRGRVYARTGRVRDLSIAPGTVSAQVTGSEAEPYDVTLRVAVLPPASWRKVIEAMSKQAIFAAELLSGRMPANIDEAFRAAGHSVFLGKQRELEADCTCADWASPCKHVAAVHYVLGEAFDKDPFLLFELRGRNRAQVLGALRAARASDAGRGNAADATMLEKITATANGRSPRIVDSPSKSNTVALSEPLTGFTPADFERAPVLPSTLGFRIEAPAVSGALLRQLGPPPSWNEEDLPFETLMDLYRLASRKALALALPDSPPASSANGESQATKKIRRRANKSVS